VLLPNSNFLEKYQFPVGGNEWVLSILKPMAEQNEIILLDYSKRFAAADECKYFLDPLHLNSLGKETITEELLPLLKAYYQQQ
jgi:lysophospholipase L1-like esterase